MKRLVSIVSISMLALTTAYAQSDDVYYNNNNTYAYSNPDESYTNNTDNSYQEYNSNYQTFYDAMSPYGQWVNNPQYGYVWQPTAVAGDFSPYLTGGHWAYTDYGWTWVSDYDWGWAAFHYGRWFHDDMYGWMWAPGSEWAPAWVMWGSYDDNYCWAPIAPGYGFSSYYRPAAYSWNTVPCDHITQPYLNNYVVNHNTVVVNNITVIHNSGVYNNSHFFSGPRVNDVEHAIGHRIEPISISTASRPSATHISGGNIQMYRPSINRTNVYQNHNTIQHQNSMNINRADASHDNVMQRNNFSSENNNIHMGQTQRNFEQNQVQRNTERNFAQPARQQQFSQPVRENIQQRAFAQTERTFASAQRPAQQFSHQESRGSFSPQAARGGRFR
jgi:hypothetical protein